MSVDRRTFLERTAAATAALAWPSAPPATRRADDLAPIFTEIDKHHDEAVARLQEWIRQPSIAAENRGVNEGCELTMRMLKDAGFDQVTKIPTDGQPGIFATLDAGAPRTLGLYFMYDVKQVDPAEWSSPPWDAALVDRPGFGKVLIGRGAVNQKGPEATFLAALHAIRAAGKKPPLNFVLVAEGEEEIGSPHFPQIVRRPEVQAALVSPDGNVPAIDGYGAKARALSASEKAMVATAARRLDEAVAKREMGVDHWVHDVSWVEALERLVSRPTVNIEGLVGGYTGPGGKTILPHRAVAKL